MSSSPAGRKARRLFQPQGRGRLEGSWGRGETGIQRRSPQPCLCAPSEGSEQLGGRSAGGSILLKSRPGKSLSGAALAPCIGSCLGSWSTYLSHLRFLPEVKRGCLLRPERRLDSRWPDRSSFLASPGPSFYVRKQKTCVNILCFRNRCCSPLTCLLAMTFQEKIYVNPEI